MAACKPYATESGCRCRPVPWWCWRPGDPLCYGIGARLIAELGPDAVTVHPNISAMAAAFARIKEPWGHARLVSLHGGGNMGAFWQALRGENPVAVLTDPQNSPDRLAALMAERGLDQVSMAIFERMGAPDERVAWHTPAQAREQRFAEPNMIVVKPAAGNGAHAFMGMPESAFDHEQGLITKTEVRAVSLAALQLRPGLTLWDLGAGSGSVGIEAALLLGSGRVVAVERDAGRLAMIAQNARRHCVYNLETVRADLPGGMEELPKPHRIFVGGGGRDLAAIVAAAAAYLPTGGILVANTVLTANLDAILDQLEQAGLSTHAVQLQVSRSRPMPWSRRFEALNPVWILSGRKEG